MAEESMLDKAMALIPGRSSRTARPTPKTHQQRLATVQRNLAKLARDVEKLTAMIAAQAKKAAPASRS